MDPKLIEKAKNIKLLISDIDGVLTDGYLFYTENGEAMRAFHVHDGVGLKLLMYSGVHVGVISAATSAIVTKRMAILGIEHTYFGQINKEKAYDALLAKLNLSPEQVAVVGDDLPDLPLILRSGLGIAVANAVSQLHQHADWVTQRPGGHGAIREVCETIMTAQNSMELAFQRFNDQHA